MGFFRKPETPEQIRARVKERRQERILRDFDMYGVVYYFQKCHIDAWYDLNQVMFDAGRITLWEYNQRKGAIDNLASQFFREYASTLEANNTLYQLKVMTHQINEQLEKVKENE